MDRGTLPDLHPYDVPAWVAELRRRYPAAESVGIQISLDDRRAYRLDPPAPLAPRVMATVSFAGDFAHNPLDFGHGATCPEAVAAVIAEVEAGVCYACGRPRSGGPEHTCTPATDRS